MLFSLHEHMLQYVVLNYDKEYSVPFKVTPPMLDGFAYGHRF
jgi:hypothetical protein